MKWLLTRWRRRRTMIKIFPKLFHLFIAKPNNFGNILIIIWSRRHLVNNNFKTWIIVLLDYALMSSFFRTFDPKTQKQNKVQTFLIRFVLYRANYVYMCTDLDRSNNLTCFVKIQIIEQRRVISYSYDFKLTRYKWKFKL